MALRRVIVIGASAGGLAALRALVSRLPSDLSAPVLIVMHLSPDSPSILAQLLGSVSALPVAETADGVDIQAGKIYVAQPDRHLLIDNGRLRLTRGPKENRSRPAIDALFRSAAWQVGAGTIGIVLTGMLDDGTAGLWAIKDRGGITIVQNPSEALYSSMPASAIRHVSIDYIVTVAEIPELIQHLVAMPVTGSAASASDTLALEAAVARGEHRPEDVMALGPTARVTCPSCHGSLATIREGSIVRYRCHTGHAFSSESLTTACDAEVDERLMEAARALDERAHLSLELERASRATGDTLMAEHHAQMAAGLTRRARDIKALLLQPATAIEQEAVG